MQSSERGGGVSVGVSAVHRAGTAAARSRRSVDLVRERTWSLDST